MGLKDMFKSNEKASDITLHTAGEEYPVKSVSGPKTWGDYYREQLIWEAYWAGYKQAYGVEQMTDLDERAAKSQFETWYARNVDGGMSDE